MDSILELIKELENAKKPSIELDARIHMVFKNNVGADNIPKYTESVDEALKLLPKRDKLGNFWRVFIERKPTSDNEWWTVTTRPHAEDGYVGLSLDGLPFAICACALRALIKDK